MNKNRERTTLGAAGVTLVMYDEPLAKASLLETAAAESGRDVIYVDFDLMCSGHLKSGMLRLPGGSSVLRPGAGGVKDAMASAVLRASRGDCLVVIDSLNGMHRACAAHEIMAANASLMMLASVGRQAGSSVIVACMARNVAAHGWTLVPMGRRVVTLGDRIRRVWAHAGEDGLASVEEIGAAQEPPQTPL